MFGEDTDERLVKDCIVMINDGDVEDYSASVLFKLDKIERELNAKHTKNAEQGQQIKLFIMVNCVVKSSTLRMTYQQKVPLKLSRDVKEKLSREYKTVKKISKFNPMFPEWETSLLDSFQGGNYYGSFVNTLQQPLDKVYSSQEDEGQKLILIKVICEDLLAGADIIGGGGSNITNLIDDLFRESWVVDFCFQKIQLVLE